MLTRGHSLTDWVRIGIFNREMSIYYKHLEERTVDVLYVISYSPEDQFLHVFNLDYFNSFIKKNKIFVLTPGLNIWKKFSLVYSALIPFKYKKIFAKSKVKSNQFDNGFTILLAKIFLRKNILVRGGYSKTQYYFRKRGLNFKLLLIFLIEFLSIWAGSKVVISNEPNRIFIKRFVLLKNKILLQQTHIPDSFNSYCKYSDRVRNSFIYVGRIEEDKGLPQLLDKFINSNNYLTIVGKGEYSSSVIEVVKHNSNITYVGSVNNEDLVNLYNKHKYYVSFSENEGLPKTLIESMACGCIPFIYTWNYLPTYENLNLGEICQHVSLISHVSVDSLMGEEKGNQLSDLASKYAEGVFSLKIVYNKEVKLLSELN